MHPARWSVEVIIPAHNEAATIGACIDSVLAAAIYAGCAPSLWIVVVADACTDATTAVARAALGSRGEVIETQVRSAGAARRIGADAALARRPLADRRRIWLANTDADTHVCRDWLEVQLALADQDIVGVAGIVRLGDDGSEAAQEIYRQTYAVRNDGTHTHVHGANIALRADAYLDIGGWNDRPLAEDHCLWNRLQARGWPVHSPVNSVVVTSGRLQGRAAGGFADTLKRRIEARYGTP
jgi:glycosyltransferase involved in cell wall biosynthesis